MTKLKNNKALKIALIVLIAILLISFIYVIIGFGWIAGIVWLIFFRKKLTNPTKRKYATVSILAFSIFSFGIMVYAFAFAPPSVDKIVISSDMEGKELEVNQDYLINIEYEPKDATRNLLKFNTDTDIATFQKKDDTDSQAILHTLSGGKVTISVSNGGTQSNSLEFTIFDETNESTEPETQSETENEKTMPVEEKTSETPIANTGNTEKTDIDTQNRNNASEEPTTTETESPEIKSGSYEIAGENFYFSDNVRNDVTGNWRISTIASSLDATDYAVEYYKNLFSSDKEIHAVVNFSTKTTTIISVLFDKLDITIREYVDKEEHDAKVLGSGQLLKEYWINIKTGEIEEIQPNQTNESKGSDNDTSSSSSNIEASPNADMVWIDDTGKKYHSKSSCSNMDAPYQVTRSEAEAMGRGPCKKCY